MAGAGHKRAMGGKPGRRRGTKNAALAGAGPRRRTKYLAAALLVSCAIGFTAFSGTSSLSGIPSVLADPLSIFAARSPGARADGALTQSKPRRQPLAEAVEPPAFVRPRPEVASVPSGKIIYPESIPSFDPIGLPPSDDIVGDPGAVPLGAIPFGAGGPGTGLLVEGIGGGSGGGGGSTVPSDPGGVPQPEPTPPVSAVPEPQTWLTMLVGFFLLGMTLRTRGRTRISKSALPGKASRDSCA